MNLGCAQNVAEWDGQGGGALAAPQRAPSLPTACLCCQEAAGWREGAWKPQSPAATEEPCSAVPGLFPSLPGVRYPLPTPHCPVSPEDSSSPGSESVNPGAVGAILYPPPLPASTAPRPRFLKKVPSFVQIGYE